MLKPALVAMLNHADSLIRAREWHAAHRVLCAAHRIAEKDQTIAPHRLAKIREARAVLVPYLSRH
ncbi:hypothetical protein ABIF65_003711 [Bradyrhizobium japonicum]|uniref:hypothetical protein n=1 Tax=Bradyrhizobium TaxID=374 RepID=UPI0004BB4611|nr:MULTISPECIES: hypothetical protein [Bradyrhizobium]MBR1005020.1 hypothetical protein [Bradyrhizobium liaoningense]MBR1030086.1 hypothetical protein [Bradyrhizobium liaoningense]MBR1066860.1 hypothetical protein [Bradyrhizobium liaoningense]MDI2074508.1 hypothetical protein [Bradyrhizobium sp. Mp27]